MSDPDQSKAAPPTPDQPRTGTKAPSPAPEQPQIGTSVKVALIGALASVVVGWVLAPWIELFRTLPLHVQLWLPPGIGIAVAGLLYVPALRRFFRRHVKVIRFGLLALAGAGLTTVVWAAFQTIAADDQCPAPTELRLVTAPENAAELTSRARLYAQENQIDGCPSLRMTVAVAPPPVHLPDAFNNEWEWREDRRDQPYARLYGLQPDAWIATTPAEPDELRAGGLKSLGDSASDIGVGQDQLVLAMTEQRREELGRHMSEPDRYSFKRVWDVLTTKMGMAVARPFPETSVAALIGTSDVFRGRGLPEKKYGAAEQELVGNGLGADTVTSLLCAFDGLAKEAAAAGSGDPKVALLVPGHSVDDYNAGRIADCPGTGASTRLIAVRHHDLSVLDYRYVGVTWPGQRSAGREALVEHFGRWLRSHPMFPNVPVSSRLEVDEERLGQLKKLLLDQLRPQLDLRLIIDTSGSADRPVRVQAAEALRAQLRMLGPRDRVQAFGLHSRTKGGRAELTAIAGRTGRQQLGTVAVEIENTAFDQWDAPASAGLAELGGDEAVPAPVVLLTDGRLFDNEGGGDAASALAGALDGTATVSGLYVVVFGQDQCAVTTLPGTSKPYHCVTAGTSPDKAITRAIITVRGWR
ncbi:vWA domain-containing protein [Nonomuraea phyllanthi]|uniref:hypothetical protein n=1 Tax=Nonomuraea phyllanthi TaxID=2219224 RepID=UPI001292E11D|nr:hypothetical protein [Nonomuraea phyllanthi]